MQKKLSRLLTALAVLLVLLAALWYARPVDVYSLAPGLTAETVDVTHWFVVRYAVSPEGEFSEEMRTSGVLSPAAAATAELRSLLEDLRFRRPLWNLVRPYLHGVQRPYPLEDGDESWSLNLSGDGGSLHLHFHRSGGEDYWEYGDLPCALVSDEETAEALGEFLWEMAEPVS